MNAMHSVAEKNSFFLNYSFLNKSRCFCQLKCGCKFLMCSLHIMVVVIPITYDCSFNKLVGVGKCFHIIAVEGAICPSF